MPEVKSMAEKKKRRPQVKSSCIAAGLQRSSAKWTMPHSWAWVSLPRNVCVCGLSSGHGWNWCLKKIYHPGD